MSQRRDTQRNRLVEAESTVPQQSIPVTEVLCWLRRTVPPKWWEFRLTRSQQSDVVAYFRWAMWSNVQYTDRRNCHPNYDGRVRVPASGSVSLLDVCHQLAHVLTPRSDKIAYHGPEFTKNYLTVVRRLLGDDTWKTLRRAFLDHHVRIIVVDDHLRAVRRAIWYQRILVDKPSLADMVAEVENYGS